MEVAQEAKQTGNSLFGKALYEESLAKYEEGKKAVSNMRLKRVLLIAYRIDGLE